MTGLNPDYGCVVVGANMGLQKMTKEHIGLCLFLKIPFFVIITKTDMAPKNKYDETVDEMKKLLKHKLLNKFPLEITDKTSENVLNLIYLGNDQDHLTDAIRKHLPHLPSFKCYQGRI